MSPAMSAISFVMDGVAHAANDGFVSTADGCSAAKMHEFTILPVLARGFHNDYPAL
jgi:hypothetical protein